MRISAMKLARGLASSAGAGIVGLLFVVAPAALALERDHTPRIDRIDHHDGWDDGWDDFNQTRIQMQRESISSQEEQAREAGRVLRRNEIEKKQEKSAAEHEAYFDAILEDSQAALKAPRGVYYRKPGYSATDGAGAGGKTFESGGLTVFYLPDGYVQETVKGLALYRFGEVFFKPVFIQGVLAYQVAVP